jgi:hypothetical protein
MISSSSPEINPAREQSAYLQSDRRAEKNIFGAFRTNAVCSARACVGRFGFHVNETIVSLFVRNVINARESALPETSPPQRAQQRPRDAPCKINLGQAHHKIAVRREF